MLTHADKKNNIALKIVSGAVFSVLDLRFYNWKWVREWQLIEVELRGGKHLFEVYKWEQEIDEDKLTAVVVPIKEVAP
jgi:hypothetical protein